MAPQEQEVMSHCDSCLSPCPGNPQQLSGVLRLHLGEGLLVSGGVSSHTRLVPLQGDKLELGVVSKLSSVLIGQPLYGVVVNG